MGTSVSVERETRPEEEEASVKADSATRQSGKDSESDDGNQDGGNDGEGDDGEGDDNESGADNNNEGEGKSAQKKRQRTAEEHEHILQAQEAEIRTLGRGLERQCKDLFDKYDKDNTGFIGPKHIRRAFANLGQKITLKRAKRMIRKCDTEKRDGTVNLREFMVIVARAKPETMGQDMELRAAFKKFDNDGDGFISARDLRRASDWPDSVIDELLNHTDIDGDGKIGYPEFKAILTYQG